MIASLLGGLWPYILGALGVVAALWAARASGSATERQRAALGAAKATAKAERNRTEKDDEIDQSTDLIDRARAAGLVRKP